MTLPSLDRRSMLKVSALGAVAIGAQASPAQAATPFASPALRAEWYDLPADKAQDWLVWLHKDYLPKLKASPGVVWVGHYQIEKKSGEPSQAGGLRRVETDDKSVPNGADYVLVTAGASPETFLAWESPISTMEKAVEDRLSQRKGYRQAIYIEEYRVDGPVPNPTRDKEAPPAMQLGNFNVRTPDDDFELARYYRLSRFPEVQMTIGSMGARKLVSIAGWPKHGILYEFSSMNPGEQVFEQRMLVNRKPVPVKLKAIQQYVVHAPGAPHAGRRIWPEG